MTGWTIEDLAAKGYAPDGTRHQRTAAAPQPADRGARKEAGSAVPVASGGSPGKLSTAAIAKLQPEQRLQIAVVQRWRPLLAPRTYLLAVNGELPGGGRVQALRAAVRREMGYRRGTADLLVFRYAMTLWLELKVNGNQSDEQAQFANDVINLAHGYAVVTSVEDAGAVLKLWGMLA